MSDTDQLHKASAQPLFLLDDHAIHGLFHLDLEFGSIEKVEATLHRHAKQAQAMRAADLPKRLQLSWQQPDKEADLWVPFSGKGMALDDFYPYARQILGTDGMGNHAKDAKDAKEDTEDTEDKVCVSLRLSKEGRRILSKSQDEKLQLKSRLWGLYLQKAARERCGRDEIDLQFCNARLFLFRTGVAILDLSWHYIATGDGLPALVVLEGNYFLSHANQRAEKDDTHPNGNQRDRDDVTTPPPPPPLTALRLIEVAKALLPQTWAQKAGLQPHRLLMYSLARVQGRADEETLLELGIRFSHRQTSDYRPKSRLLESSVLQPFPYLCHVLAPEGAASVIATEEDAASGFFKDFIPGTGANTYVPLFVASLHNHLWLLAQTEWLPATRSQKDKRHEIHDLEDVYERTVEFRRYFYFPMISQISLHNAFYERSQEVFKIAQRQRFLEQTTHVSGNSAALLPTRHRWRTGPSAAAGRRSAASTGAG
ncbi:MAG: hypothetical protein KGO02_20490 [Alphaproteobacteria bacterium]|nr:hypothetical protein [Alphaproteobacteria bacterium]